MTSKMREMNIAAVDLNLVPALEALLRHRSVTRAAGDVGLSQPAMSRALARLRELQDDPLLVRTRAGYVLTPRAEALQPLLAGAMASLRDMFRQTAIEPAAVQRTVRLAGADGHAVLIVPGLMARLAVEAPGVDLRIEPYRPDTLVRFENGALDFIFALASSPLPPGASSEIVGEDRVALVMRRGHPAADRAWTVEDYGRYSHVGVALLGDGRSEIDALLAAHNVTRRIALVTSTFVGALAAVAGTDMVTTLSEALARRFASAFDLVLLQSPLGDSRMQTTLVCSHVKAADPFLRWFRGLVREVASN